MAKFNAAVEASAVLTTEAGSKITLKVDDVIESISYTSTVVENGRGFYGLGQNPRYEDVKVENATVLGFEIGNKTYNGRFGPIYDGIPTAGHQTDDMANFDDLIKNKFVKAIIVEYAKDDKPVREVIQISKITDIQGSFENEDGTQYKTVNLSEDGSSVSSAISEVPAGSTVALNDGTVEEALTVDKEVTIAGSNAGIAQNFKQEV